MHENATSAQVRARIGGLTRAATAPTPQAITQAARDGRWQKYIDKAREIAPEADEADIIRRAELLRRVDMTKMSLKAAKARRMKADLAALESELDASGLADAGSDGVDKAPPLTAEQIASLRQLLAP